MTERLIDIQRREAARQRETPRSDGAGAAGPLDRLVTRLALQGVAGLRQGRIEFELPDGTTRTFGVPQGEPQVRVDVHDWRFFRRVALEGGTGAGGAYIDGHWSCDDLVGLVRLVIGSELDLDRAVPLGTFGRTAHRLAHRLRRNTIRRSRRNIADHYDLGNDFYALWLDPSMTYSCALFSTPDESLEQAQRNKLRRLAEKARLEPGLHVLEIGCGWGGFAELAAREYGCRVTGITISRAQADYARARLQAAGVADQAEVQIVDYRRVEGSYDRIVSIEMAEAVGHEYLADYCAAFDRLLAPEGLAVLQVITIPDARYRDYLRGTDYTRRYVFPGSHLPSLGALTAALAKTSLSIEDLENIGVHYAETLRRWRVRFLERADAVRALGFDDGFCRRWEFYLAFCEAGFLDRHLNDLQIVLTRQGNPTLPGGPHPAARRVSPG